MVRDHRGRLPRHPEAGPATHLAARARAGRGGIHSGRPAHARFPAPAFRRTPARWAGVQTGISPLINLGEDLRRGDPVIALNIRRRPTNPCTSGSGPSSSSTDAPGRPRSCPRTEQTVAQFPQPPGLGYEVVRSELTADVSIGDIGGRWLPLPYPSVSVEGVTGGWYWEPEGLSARSPDTAVRGQQYTVTFLDVQPTLEQVGEALPFSAQDAGMPTTILPARIPDVIAETAQQIAGDLPTSYERAMALQDFFTSGEFEYSTNAPVAGNYDGTGLEVIARFLAEKSGYCVHYASAMAVMARILGIPSRVAVGFQPGEPLSAQGITNYTVTSHDLHAWPELYFDGVGWLRFEPTPGRGELPDYNYVPPVDDPATPEDEGAAPTPAATSTAGPGAERPDESDLGVPGAGGAATSANPTPFVLLGVGVLIAIALVAPAAIRTVIRLRRERSVRLGRDPAEAAWAELRDTARDHGWAAPDSETPRDFADRLAVVLSGERERIDGLRGDVEESAFAPPGRGAPTVDELRAVRRAIARSVDPRDRIRAIVLPASLLARFRWDPEG
ncbi:MAG: transglutaminaseTgpA domain-containing protein [Schumannella sp.]